METVPTDRPLPSRIERLHEISRNLWWTWQPNARNLFSHLDKGLWIECNHNPVKLMQRLSEERLREVAEDPIFLRYYDGLVAVLDNTLTRQTTWFARRHPEHLHQTIAYFSAEFGLHISLPIYSGGLGVLAGDHCKESSDLGLPLVGVGFVYPLGYFKQKITAEGRQEAIYERFDYAAAPIEPVFSREAGTGPFRLEIGGQALFLAVWRVRVGSVTLYLMDTDVPENEPWDRELSASLYGGDQETRIRQEIVLGIGGIRLLRALGIEPAVCHANEGHAAFMMLERVRLLVEQGLPFHEAAEKVRETTVFTTHTPVPAGHDAFPFHLVEKHFEHYWGELGLDRRAFLSLGEHPDGYGGVNFNMTALAMRLSGHRNGVSRLHGEVSREMWHSLWPDRPVADVPIGHITNGVHTPSWVAPELDRLYTRYLGYDWRHHLDDQTLWDRVLDIPDEELWAIHGELKGHLLRLMRERIRQSWVRDAVGPLRALTAGPFLDPQALTIGFARRFATYKRALLIFSDLARLIGLLNSEFRPIQIIFAGKAHPADLPGSSMIQEINRLAREHNLAGRIAFIEDYDMRVAKYLVRGVDLWLNNPRRPLEASGTSGQKASLNGVPNLSVLDGWWDEGYRKVNGWAIDPPVPPHASQEARDTAEAAEIYRLLEEQVVPLFFDRDRQGVPRGWVQVMKEAIRTNAPLFSTRRMVREYAEKMYLPAMRANGSRS